MKKRLQNLDFLRAIFIFFALLEHYGFFVNTWFVLFFDKDVYNQDIGHYFKSSIGQYLHPDIFGVSLLSIFTIWVSHIYLSLITFNISQKKPSEIDVMRYLKGNALLLMAFVGESFIIANNMGEAFTVHPIYIWLILSSLLVVLYKFFDNIGIILMGLFGIIYFYLIKIFDWSNIFNNYMQANFHKAFYYDAKIEYFILSGVIGFLIGFIYKNVKNKKWIILFSLSILLFLLGLFFNNDFIFNFSHQNLDEMFNNEKMFYLKFGNILYINSIIVFIISLFLFLENKGITLSNMFFNYISFNSITIFFLHRILFIKILMPIRLIIGTYLNIPITNNIIELILFVFECFFITYIMQKNKIFQRIFSLKD